MKQTPEKMPTTKTDSRIKKKKQTRSIMNENERQKND